MIHVKRVYEPAAPEDGRRFLVDRLWPRGIKREALVMQDWLKDAAPSNELRKWYTHDPAKWEPFCRRYFSELDAKPEIIRILMNAARQGDISLLYSSHEPRLNNAAALKLYLEVKFSMEGES